MRARAVVIGLSVALLLGACSGTGTKGSTAGFVGSDGTTTVVAVADRKAAPVLSGQGIDGNPLTTADFEGQVLVVNLWGSWCSPCRKEAPVLAEVSAEYADQGVQFIGVNVRDNPDSAVAFNKKFGITFPSIDDYDSSTVRGFTSSLPARTIPTTWIIDAEGRVAVRIMNQDLRASTLSGLIDDVKSSVG